MHLEQSLRLVKEQKDLETSKDHPNYSIIKISQNTEKSLGDCLSNSSEKPSATAGVKNYQKRTNNNNNRYSHRSIGTRTRILGNKRTNGYHLNYSTVMIKQSTEKSPGDLRRLVTQTPVRNHQLTLV